MNVENETTQSHSPSVATIYARRASVKSLCLSAFVGGRYRFFRSASSKLSCLLMGLCAFAPVLFAATPEEMFHQANTSFASGKYTDAIRDYESLIAQGKSSSSVFYNLGNAYFRDGKAGLAILNYERALWLSPGDADIKANLRFVRKAAGLFEPSTSWWRIHTTMMSLNAWTWLSSAFLFLLSLTLIVRWMKWDRSWSMRPLIFLFSFALLFSTTSAMLRASDLQQAIVILPETPLRVAPLDTSPSSSSLSAGSLVRVLKQHGTFFYIQTEDGKKGWASDKQVQKIVS